jgi:hypothetical protein
MMDSEQEAEVQRIVARYVEEVQAGLRPRLQEYFVRYPQYADAIADFVAYYQAVEAHLPQQEDATTTALPSSLSALLPKIQQRALSTLSEGQVATGITSLFLTATQDVLDETRLAKALDLSEDSVIALEQRKVLPETLPRTLLQRLSGITGYTVREIQEFFKAASHHYQQQDNTVGSVGHVAELNATYMPQYSFLEIIEASPTLSQEQKWYWREVVESEKKGDADE